MILTACLKCNSKDVTHICDKVLLETKTICFSCGNEFLSKRGQQSFEDDLEILKEIRGYSKKVGKKI
ncbi:MAG TPA: hypothetical protein VJA47_04725 [archaeon]|nr:hypothetical protein [archaeon]